MVGILLADSYRDFIFDIKKMLRRTNFHVDMESLCNPRIGNKTVKSWNMQANERKKSAKWWMGKNRQTIEHSSSSIFVICAKIHGCRSSILCKKMSHFFLPLSFGRKEICEIDFLSNFDGSTLFFSYILLLLLLKYKSKITTLLRAEARTSH